MNNISNRFFAQNKCIIRKALIFIVMVLLLLLMIFSVSKVFAFWKSECTGSFLLQVGASEEPEIAFGIDEADCWIGF